MLGQPLQFDGQAIGDLLIDALIDGTDIGQQVFKPLGRSRAKIIAALVDVDQALGQRFDDILVSRIEEANDLVRQPTTIAFDVNLMLDRAG